MIDLHCHILPDIDDGAFDIAESIAMARMAVDDGIRTIVATPHTLNDVYLNDAETVCTRVGRLNAVFQREQIPLNLCPGSDMHVCVGMRARIQAGEAASINMTGRYVLVEFPVQAIPDGSREELFQLKLHRIIPVITHPERNRVFQNDLDALAALVAQGCLVQVTAMSITGEMGEDAMQSAHEMLLRRLVHVIASDAHSAQKRPPLLRPAVEAAAGILGSRREAEAMVIDRPADIVAGRAVSIPEPPLTVKRKWWQIWG